jgi:hypothetical protein
MENSIPPPPPPYLPNVVAVPTAPRPTATPVRVRFSDVLASGAQALVRGAQAAASVLPGAPIAAMALRGGATGWTASGIAPLLSASGSMTSAAMVTSPEGPGGIPAAPTATTGAAGATSADGIQSTMAQSEQMNLYYLQVQEEVNSQNRTFTTLSNVLEVENNTAKSAIGNIH